MNPKNLLFSVLLAITVIMTGCGNMNQAERPLDGDNELDQFDNSGNTNVDDEISSKLGYVRYNKDEIDTNGQSQILSINRHELADAITRMVLRYDDFDNVATLVTDDEVLIAYNKPGDIDREEAASMVKKTALSVVPRFYHVYVSDQPVTFRDIQSLQNSNTLNDDYQNTLEDIINDMKETPQGEKVYEEEQQYQ